MSKTIFQNGTVVTSNYLNTIYNTNGGHKHDGGGEDGHVEKIDINNHTSGLLGLTKLYGFGQGDINCWVPADLADTPEDIPVTVRFIRFLNYVQLYIPRVEIETTQVGFEIRFPPFGLGQTLFNPLRPDQHIPYIVINEDASTESTSSPGALTISPLFEFFLFEVQKTDPVSGLSIFDYFGFDKRFTGCVASVVSFYIV